MNLAGYYVHAQKRLPPPSKSSPSVKNFFSLYLATNEALRTRKSGIPLRSQYLHSIHPMLSVHIPLL